ncbi:DUF3037 domain-containing protein [Lacticaseibacillus suilingensis]|uniref:DUF3037 domain-containing protein n=1 Tax=Lacticaseibacillus suilingensis TaxID=2799577 RepID=UPI0022E815D6|nr:DUF3037 domain-containing protein [Lacticaseibacillus suilingensis]
MASRTQYEYSIITYFPDRIRAEQINIGLILASKTTHELHHFLLKENTSKIRGLVPTDMGRKVFASTIKYMNFMLLQQEKNYQIDLLTDQIAKGLPEGVVLGPRQTALTTSPKNLFETLIKTYVGSQYLDNNEESQLITPRQFSERIFSEKSVLGTRVKKDIRLQPSKHVPLRLQMDFVFENDGELGLINSVPSLASADSWYSKMVLLTSRFENASKIIFLNDSKIFGNNTISQILDDLSSQDSRVETFDIGKNSNKSGRGKTQFLTTANHIAENSNADKLNVLLAKQAISA